MDMEKIVKQARKNFFAMLKKEGMCKRTIETLKQKGAVMVLKLPLVESGAIFASLDQQTKEVYLVHSTRWNSQVIGKLFNIEKTA